MVEERSNGMWLWFGVEPESSGFKEALRPITQRGLIGVGIIGLAGVLFFVGVNLFVLGDPVAWLGPTSSDAGTQVYIADPVGIALISAGLIAVGWRNCSVPVGRTIMAAAALAAATVSLSADALRGHFGDEYAGLCFVAGVVAVPFRPWQAGLLGGVVTGLLYTVGTYGPTIAPNATVLQPPFGPAHLIRMGLLVVLMTGVSALLYVSRYRQYRSRREAEKLRDEVTELEAAKTRFFANISHELRTPLTLIKGPLEDVLSGRYGDLSDELRRRLETMKEQATRLGTLVDQLLQLSELDEGRMDIAAQPIGLSNFLPRMAGLFSSMADRKKVEMRVEVPDEPVVCADPEALKQIVSNLVANGLEHTPEGGTVRIGAYPEESGQTRISVRDTGPGLPEEVRGALFDRYYGSEAENGEYVDVTSGVGLAIVKELTERHCGRVRAESEPGFGTEMIVWLPATCAVLPEEDRASSPDKTRLVVESEEREIGSDIASATRITEQDTGDVDTLSGEKSSVLVVDDEAVVRRYLSDLLQPSSVSCFGGWRRPEQLFLSPAA